MKTTAAEILSAFAPQGLIKEMVGPDQPILRIAPVEDCGPGDLVFVDKTEYAAVVAQRRPAVAVTSPKLQALLAGCVHLTLLLTPNVNLAQALIKQRYAGRQFDAAGWPRIHPSAVVHETAVLPATAVVEPRAVIGRNVRVGERTRIMAGAIIEHDAQLGSDTVVHPNAVVGYGCAVGNEAVIGAGAIIGSEGYGFAQDEKGKSLPIPQTGNVVLGDRVRVGANCCIDRAAYRTTRIGAGTKLDNLCHIAHNVQVGEDCLLTAMFCVAGSTTLGNRIMASGQTGILDHLKICDDVVLVHRAGVSADIGQPGVYAGIPVQPLKEYLRNTAVVRMLADLRQRLLTLERRAGDPPSLTPDPGAS
jgi:UDP-3-O-[3-hydroxymyristoyl] glucosamine N-acyltransferase